jgi:hypothetical protein
MTGILLFPCDDDQQITFSFSWRESEATAELTGFLKECSHFW